MIKLRTHIITFFLTLFFLAIWPSTQPFAWSEDNEEKSGKFEVPDPEPDNNIVVEFANSMDGTDGTPQGLAAKLSAAQKQQGFKQSQQQSNTPQPQPTPPKPSPAPTPNPDRPKLKEELPVMGF